MYRPKKKKIKSFSADHSSRFAYCPKSLFSKHATSDISRRHCTRRNRYHYRNRHDCPVAAWRIQVLVDGRILFGRVRDRVGGCADCLEALVSSIIEETIHEVKMLCLF